MMAELLSGMLGAALLLLTYRLGRRAAGKSGQENGERRNPGTAADREWKQRMQELSNFLNYDGGTMPKRGDYERRGEDA